MMGPLEALERLLEDFPDASSGLRLAVAWSGGLDSTVLLHCAAQLRTAHGFVLQALHVHHALQPAAEQWAARCAEQAAEWDVPLTILRVQVAAADIRALGIEAAARAARYRALAQCPTDLLLLAHHRDDQAESVLLQMLRGAGPAGLAGMGADVLPVRHALRSRVVRPFLQLSRAHLVTWAEANALRWSEDPSNSDTRFDRNHLRHVIGPALAARHPAWQAAFVRSAGWAAEAQMLLEELAEVDLDHVGMATESLPDPACLPLHVAALRSLGEARQRNLVRYVLAKRGLPAPPGPRLIEWLRQLDAEPARCPELIWQGWSLRRWGGLLWLEPDIRGAPAWAEAAFLGWDGLSSMRIDLPGRGCLDLISVHAVAARSLKQNGRGTAILRLRSDCGPLRLAPCSGNQSLQLFAGGPHRALRKLFQERGIPPWRRARLPGLFAGRELVALPGLVVAAGWHGNAAAAHWQLIWHDAALLDA